MAYVSDIQFGDCRVFGFRWGKEWSAGECNQRSVREFFESDFLYSDKGYSWYCSCCNNVLLCFQVSPGQTCRKACIRSSVSFCASGDKQFVWLCCVKLFNEKCISIIHRKCHNCGKERNKMRGTRMKIIILWGSLKFQKKWWLLQKKWL